MEGISGAAPQNDNEEAKVSKGTGKRGRPRKNPVLAKDDSSSAQKSKRGRKPKRYDDIDPNNAGGHMNVTFNESEAKDEMSDEYPLNENEMIRHIDSPMGPIEKNMKMIDSHNFSFDSMANLGKNEAYTPNHPPFYPRKQSLNNPFDQFFNGVPKNMEYMNEPRSRRISSVLSPYHGPMNGANIVSPNPLRGMSFTGNNDFNGKNFSINPQNNQEADANQKKLNDLIAQSFQNWNTKPKRKETEDIDFSGQDNPILNILNKNSGSNNGQRKASPFDYLSNSIMSPDYKPRSFSINSSGWLPPHVHLDDKKHKSGWDNDKNDSPSKSNHEDVRSNNGKEMRVIKVSTFTRKGDNSGPPSAMRKSTMIDTANAFHKTSPLVYPKFSAAFKPFKKRSMSFHTPQPQIHNVKFNGHEFVKKRESKAEEKAIEEHAE